MSDWSSPRKRRNNGLFVLCGMVVICWMLFHLPSRMASLETVVPVASVIFATGVIAILPLTYDGPYMVLGNKALHLSRQMTGFNAEQPEPNVAKGIELHAGAYIEMTRLENPDHDAIWSVVFFEPGRSLVDYFEFYEDGRVYWQEASSEQPLQESAWQHAGLVRLQWLTMMLQRYGTIVEHMPRRPY